MASVVWTRTAHVVRLLGERSRIVFDGAFTYKRPYAVLASSSDA